MHALIIRHGHLNAHAHGAHMKKPEALQTRSGKEKRKRELVGGGCENPLSIEIFA